MPVNVSPEAPRSDDQAVPAPVSYRALGIGALLALGICVVVAYAELVIKDIQIAICQFSPAAIGALLVVVLVNKVLARTSHRLALSPRELMIVYFMTLAAALVSSRGIMEKLLPALVAVNYHATPENHWADMFFPHIPQWLVPFDVHGPGRQEVARDFYEGLAQGQALPWRAWKTPLLAWSVAMAVVVFAFACLSTIFRRQWVDNEKLTFPLVQLPLDMVSTKRETAFFRNWLMWAGFAVPALVFGLNGLHRLYPAIPEIRLDIPLQPYFRAKPWSDMHMITIYCSFAAIGFAYFLPAQLLFSLWSFFFLSRALDVVYSVLGARIENMPLYPERLPVGYQAAGAYMVLIAFYVRAAWPHLKLVWRKATYDPGATDDRAEFMPYRVALWGLFIAFIAAVYWCTAAGMSLWLAVAQMGIYLFIVAVVMARSVAEAGMLMTEASFRPVDIVQLVRMKQSLGRDNLTALSFTDAVFTRDLRGMLMSAFLDGLKVSDEVRLNRRHLLLAMAIAIVLAYGAGIVIQLWLPYHEGAVGMYHYVYQGNPLWSFQDYAPAMEMQEPYDWRLPIAFAVGIVVATLLSVMRMRFWWWPLYPLGYALWGSWTMIVFWFPILVAWLTKSLLLRYVGMKAYTRLRPLFLGLILGEFFMALLWATVGCLWRLPGPFFPWP